MKLFMMCMVFAVVATAAMHIPLIGIVFGLLASPLGLLFPELGTTGDHVEFGFAWVTLKSWIAWVAYVGYFSLLSFGVVRGFQRLFPPR